ncbi:CheR family methyltransferase [Novosphingobium olei]|uniref:CheR family methyltransferase n=1 Tax=Novosphingobium olei TaxID=2728851 RepID=UPI003BB0FD51
MDAAMSSLAETSTEDIELDLLLEAIWRRYQYDFRNYARESLRRRMDRARTHFGCATLSELQDRVLHDPLVHPTLMGFLTIQVSEMFRDPAYFRALRENVLPHLHTWPSLKVWIAGCANGEEFWSLAILFREAGLEDRTIFYCTDINPAALEKAKAGIYDLERIPDFTRNHRASGAPGSLSEYYTAAFGAARFDPSLRRKAVFADHNLATDEVFSEVQLVSSRNVLIYFDRQLQDRALGLFASSLGRGGFLGLGSRETLRFSRHSDLFTDFVPEEKIFRRSAEDWKEPRDAAA